MFSSIGAVVQQAFGTDAVLLSSERNLFMGISVGGYSSVGGSGPRSLLYRRQILQENIRWKALDEIYKIYRLSE